MPSILSKPLTFYSTKHKSGTDEINTLDEFGNFHFWVEVGGKIIDSTPLDTNIYDGRPKEMIIDDYKDHLVYIPFTKEQQKEVIKSCVIRKDFKQPLQEYYPRGKKCCCFHNSLAQLKHNPLCKNGKLVCGGLGYKFANGRVCMLFGL